MSPHTYNGSGSGGLGKPPKLKNVPAALTAIVSGPSSAALHVPSSPLVASVTAKDLNVSSVFYLFFRGAHVV